MITSKKIPKVICLFGMPGAGKGTIGILLSGKINYYYFETSKILEETFLSQKNKVYTIEGEKYSVLKEKKLWLEGKLCSPSFVTFLVKEKIKQLKKEGKNLILSGSPRTLFEAERILPLIEKLYGKENVLVLFLKITEKETLFRNSHRRICELLRHPILYLKDNKNLKYCPLDGSRLIRRKGLDDPKTIKKRIEEFYEKTLPVLDFFKKRKIKIVEIDACSPPTKVFEDVLKALNLN
jgi:adenylate kinase family enzyme